MAFCERSQWVIHLQCELFLQHVYLYTMYGKLISSQFSICTSDGLPTCMYVCINVQPLTYQQGGCCMENMHLKSSAIQQCCETVHYFSIFICTLYIV